MSPVMLGHWERLRMNSTPFSWDFSRSPQKAAMIFFSPSRATLKVNWTFTARAAATMSSWMGFFSRTPATE